MSNWQRRISELAPPDRMHFEERAEAFETAWTDTSGKQPDIETFLEKGPLRLPLLVYFIRCDLEIRHQRGETRRTEDYLSRFPELAEDAEALVEILVCEYQLEPPDKSKAEDMVRRFPQLEEQLRKAFAAIAPRGQWVPPQEYEMLGEIGRGNWGVVYKARNRRLNRLEAIKVVAPGKMKDQGILAQIELLRKEIPKAAAFTHANIVHVYWDGESNGVPYFAMEYCPGGNLKERIEKQPYPAKDAAQLVKTLAATVNHIHAMGHIHRDLKPSNILFDQESNPKIADFGLALPRDEPSRLEIAGTPLYMAPEQIDPARGPVDPRTDVYALGVILFQLLTQNPPFYSHERAELYQKILHDPPPRLPNVPADLEAICHQCVAKDGQDRYADASQLAADLDVFLKGGLVSAKKHSIFRKAGNWVKNNIVVFTAGSAIILLALVIAVYQTVLRDQEVAQAKERQVFAENLAQKERLRQHDARVVAARQSGRRGDWYRALEDYRQAIGDAEPDSKRLRVERLVGYLATNQIAEFVGQLNDLEAQPLGDLDPQVKLMRAAWLSCDFAKQGEGRQLANALLKHRHQLFTDADRHFAEALAADRVGQALRAFGEAVKSDPLHYLAGSCYAISLAAVGEEQKARQQAEFLRGVFPFSPMPDLVETVVAFTRGERAAIKSKLAVFASKLQPKQRPAVKRIETFLLSLTDLLEVCKRIEAGDDGLFDFLLVGGLLRKAIKDGGLPNNEPLGLPIPAVRLYMDRFKDIVSCYVEVGVPLLSGANKGNALARIQALNRDYPDGVLLLMQAAVQMEQAIGPINRAEIERLLTSLNVASETCKEVVKAPSMVPLSATAYLGRGLFVISDVCALRFDARTDPIYLDRARENLHPLVVEGRRWRSRRAKMIDFIVQVATVPLTRPQAAAWNLAAPKGHEAYKKRQQQVVSLCRALLEQWSIDEPNQSSLPMLRARVNAFEESTGLVEPKRK